MFCRFYEDDRGYLTSEKREKPDAGRKRKRPDNIFCIGKLSRAFNLLEKKYYLSVCFRFFSFFFASLFEKTSVFATYETEYS